MICALLPELTLSPTASAARQADFTPAADQRVARSTGAAIDVAKVWNQERALLSAINPGTGGASASSWASAGDVASQAAAGFLSAGNLHIAETQMAVPLPPPSPVARLDENKRPAAGRKPLALRAPQLASLAPQESGSGYFNFFRKLFGDPDRAAKAMLAANPKTAIYDIEKHVVYLPSGEKLEAHSGYGHLMDDPTSVDRKNWGVTPPNIYAVSFREKLFHGVRALRLTPVGNGNMYGRDGILAHSYMLGEDGQSNGCVSVKDYQRFLQAYEDGAFNQIIVVRKVDDAQPPQVASAQPGSV